MFTSPNRPYSLRTNNQFRLPDYMSAASQNSILYKGVQLYNDLKRSFVITEDISVFKENLMQYVKSQIAPTNVV